MRCLHSAFLQDDHFLRGILFVEKAIFACPLPSKAGSSDVLGRATKTPEPWRHGLNLGDGILCLCSSSCQPGKGSQKRVEGVVLKVEQILMLYQKNG